MSKFYKWANQAHIRMLKDERNMSNKRLWLRAKAIIAPTDFYSESQWHDNNHGAELISVMQPAS